MCITAINPSPSQTETTWHLRTAVRGGLRSLLFPGSCRSLWAGCAGEHGCVHGAGHSWVSAAGPAQAELVRCGAGPGPLREWVSFGPELDLLLEELSRLFGTGGDDVAWPGKKGRHRGRSVLIPAQAWPQFLPPWAEPSQLEGFHLIYFCYTNF